MRRREFLKKAATATTVATAALSGGEIALAEILTGAADSKPLSEFDYGDVELAPGRMKEQFDQTQTVLLELDEDSLLRPWRQRAGLPAPGKSLGGWYNEQPIDRAPSGGTGFAPGHCFGQWISALARGYAVDHDPAKLARVERLLELYEPTISGKFYTNFRFPAYNYDKMVIGLIDAHQFTGSTKAFALLDKTTDAALPHLPAKALDRVEPQRQWRASVGDSTEDEYTWDESYTMPENLYLAAQRGAGERYRTLAPQYLLNETYFDPLAEGRNVLPGHHAYSFCNALSSAMQAYMVGGSEKHLRAATNAHRMILETQSYATGGWGPDEEFKKPNTGALFASLSNTHHSFETPCGSYGHAKLTRYLLRVTRDGQYGDSMERILLNTVMGVKPLQLDGRAFYYSDYSNPGSKFYFDDHFPCCAGTLPQIAADYHILGYFHDADGVYVNLYTPSTLKWKAANGAKMSLTQSGGYPLEGSVGMVLRASKATSMTLRLRIPGWAVAGAGAPGSGPVEIKVNGQPVSAPITKGFAAIERKWKDGDRVQLELPMPLRLEAIDAQHPDVVALVRGPLVLFALMEGEPKVTREQLLAAKSMKGTAVWQVASEGGFMLMMPFTEIREEKYRTYLTVTPSAAAGA